MLDHILEKFIKPKISEVAIILPILEMSYKREAETIFGVFNSKFPTAIISTLF